MNKNELIQIAFYIMLFCVLSPFIGKYMADILEGKKTFIHRILFPVESGILRLCGVRADDESNWKQYLSSVLVLNLVGFIFLFGILMLQGYLPLNPQNVKGLSPWLSFNTAVSFVTNTNWQAYSGEASVSYFSQMIGLAVQNFLSAATGIAVLAALARGIARKTSETVGSFWADITRVTLYILIPFSVVVALILVSQGVVQTFAAYVTADTIEGSKQVIPLGPAASQIAIKQIGTNGGGFFGVNSAHPFENPTAISNFVESLMILLLPASLVFTFGRMVRSQKHGLVIFAVMLSLFIAGLSLSLYSEYSYSPVAGIQSMEGKEVRFGIAQSVLWGNATTAASNGSVNAMHDSMSPISGGVFMTNIMLGEVIFGGVGSGLYGMVIFIILTVFIAGLMVGRTPEYLGKKIEKREIQMSMLAVMSVNFPILVFSAIACVTQAGLSTLNNHGPHGLSEILYAFTSAAGNNGSAFAGLGVDTPFYNVMTGLAMIIGRYGVIVPVLSIAGSLAGKKSIPESMGTFHTDSFIFAVLLVGTIIIVSALTFFPVLTLGPILEHLIMHTGRLF